MGGVDGSCWSGTVALFPATDDFSFVRSKNRFLSRSVLIILRVCFLLYFDGVIIVQIASFLGDISKKYFLFILIRGRIAFVYRKRRN